MPTPPRITGSPFPHGTPAPLPLEHASNALPQGGNQVDTSRRSPSEQRSQAARDRARFSLLSLPIDGAGRNSAPVEKTAYRSLLAWAERTREEIIKLYGEHALDQLPRNEEGNFENRQSIINAWSSIAYDLYADLEKGRGTKAFDSVGQEQFLRDLDAVAQGDGCKVLMQALHPNDPIDGLSPLAALSLNEKEANASHFQFVPHDIGTRPSVSSDGSYARITLNLSPSHVVDMSRSLVPLLSEFKDIITHFKVIAPAEQGARTDNIVIYLNQADSQRAEELAKVLSTQVPQAAWKSHTPPGMHPMRRGIAYAEFSKGAVSSSFGADRASILVDALIDHLDYGADLKDALHAVLVDRGYSPSNPALIAHS